MSAIIVHMYCEREVLRVLVSEDFNQLPRRLT